MRDQFTIAIIGAGSVMFSKGTIGDILLSEVLTQWPIDLRLMDVAPGHLEGVEQFAAASAAQLGRRLRATATTDLRAAVDGADFVITAFEVNRYHHWAQDFHIPRKYGFAQIYGENGSVLGKTYNPWYYKSSEVDIFRESDGATHRVLGADGHFYRRQLEGFADTILNGVPQSGADIEDGIASVRAMVAIAQSAREGRPVKLADVSGGL